MVCTLVEGTCEYLRKAGADIRLARIEEEEEGVSSIAAAVYSATVAVVSSHPPSSSLFSCSLALKIISNIPHLRTKKGISFGVRAPIF